MDDEYVEMDHQVSEPTDDEIREYAIWMGAELPGDEDLLHIAREALVAPVPAPWKLFCKKDGESDPFYFNPVTGESLWDHPLDEHYKNVFAQEKREKLNKTKTNEARPAGSLSGKTESKGKVKPLLSVSGDSAPPVSLGPLKGAKNIPLGSIDRKEGVVSSQRMFTDADSESMKLQMKEDIVQLRAKYESEKQQLTEQIRENSEETDKQKKLGEQIRTENIKLEENLAALKQRHESIMKQEEQKLKSSLKTMQSTYEKESSKLKDELAKVKMELESAKKNAAKDLERVKRDETAKQKEDMNRLTSGFETQRTMLIEQHQTELEKVKKDYREKMQILTDECQKELEKLRKEKEAEKEALMKETEDLKHRRELLKKDLSTVESEQDETRKDSLQKMKSEFGKQKKELEETFKKEIEKLRNEKQAEKEALSKEQASIRQEREKLRKDHDDLLAKTKLSFDQQKKEIEESNKNEIEALIVSLQTQKEALVKEQTDMKRQREEAEKEHNAAISSFNDLEKLSDLKASFETQKQDLTSQFNSEIESMKKKFEKKKQRMKKNQDEEISELEKEFSTKLNKLKAGQGEQIKMSEMQSASTELDEFRTKLNYKKTELEKQYQDEISELQDEHALEIEKQKRKYESEIQKMKISHESIIQRLELQLELSKNQLISSKHESKQYSELVEEEEEDYKDEPLMLISKSTIISIKPVRKVKCRIGKTVSFAAIPTETSLHLTHRVIADSAPLPITIPPTSLNAGFPDPQRATTAAPKISEITPLWNDDDQAKSVSANKTKKVLSKCEQTATELSDSIKLNHDEAKSALHSYKAFTMDERRRLNESSMDFQQQAAQFHRKLQSIISTVEVSLRSAVSSVNAARVPQVQYQPYIPPMPQAPSVRRSHRRVRVRDDTEEIEEEARRKLQNIRKDAAKRKPSPKRTRRKIIESDSYISD